MNLLIDPLPEQVSIDGQGWTINSSFFIGVMFELMMQDPALSGEEKVARALALYYPDIPPNPAEALDRVLWFYRCGREEEPVGRESRAKPPKAYCFEQDAELIYAAFRQYYSIDLNDVEDLHWWKFRALFRALPSDCELCKVMGYRTADLKGLPKSQKEFYRKMRARYALQNSTDIAAAASLAERDQKMRDYVAQRFAALNNAP